MESLHSYTVSGLAVSSEIPLPGLLDRPADAVPPDVTIRLGHVPDALDGASQIGPTWQLADERFLLRIPGVARFLLTAGSAIVCEPDVETDDVAVFLLGTVMGILLHQRGQIVLHASAAAVNGAAVLFCGTSGAGKSTMAAALAQRGYACVTDDLCAISIGASGTPVVHSDGRQLKLWAQSIKHLRLDDRSGKRVRRQLEKYYVEHDAAFAEPLPLGAMYALREARPPHAPGIDQPNLVESAVLVRRHAYRPLLVRRLGQHAQYFKAATAIVRSAGVYRLTRRLDFALIPESLGWLQSHWSEIGLLGGSN